MFCEQNNVHCFLVAHPTKLGKSKDTGMFEIPNMYNISGSANFYNKTDNGISVYRNYQTETTEVYVQKVKFSHWGKIGNCSFTYDLPSGRYVSDIGAEKNWIEQQIISETNKGTEVEVQTYEMPLVDFSEAKSVFEEINYNINGEIKF